MGCENGSPQFGSAQSFLRLRILLAEDDPEVAEVLEAQLDYLGFDVVHAQDGAAAVERFRDGGFAAIVSDLRMPRVGGLELLRRIRVLDREIPFVIMTGSPCLDSAIAALRLQASDYLLKPVPMVELNRALERLLPVVGARALT